MKNAVKDFIPYNIGILMVIGAIFCFMSLSCQLDAVDLNGGILPSIAGLLAYKFNTFSYIYIGFLPCFIVFSYQFIHVSKYEEFVLSRFAKRGQYFLSKQLKYLKICVVYRLFELIITVIVYTISYLFAISKEAFWGEISENLKVAIGIPYSNVSNVFWLSITIQLLLLLLYFLFIEIILGLDIYFGNSVAVLAITCSVDIILLLTTKCKFWITDANILNLLPNYNFLFEFMFTDSMYSISRILLAYLYWVVIIGIMIYQTNRLCLRHDYIFIVDNED